MAGRLVGNNSTTTKTIYEFIVNFTRERHIPPTMREVQAGVGLKSVSTVAHHIKRLEAQGLLRKRLQRWQAIQVFEDDSPTL